MKMLSSKFPEDWRALVELFAADVAESEAIDGAVRQIIAEVRRRGDAAVLQYSAQFEAVQLTAAELSVAPDSIAAAGSQVHPRFSQALAAASENIEDFHRRQLERSWEYERDGVRLGQRVVPISRVGIYVPGGRALYPSSVLMMAIPAKLAGVERLVMVTPPRAGGADLHLLAAAKIAGVHEIYQVGGAQAIAALAYGTETIPAVDKIVGPGNAYVAAAKRLVFGQVDIDNVAGPTEIAILADDSANAEWIAYDLISQLEHDPDAKGLLVTPSIELINEVSQYLDHLVDEVPRRDIVAQAFAHNCPAFLVGSLAEGIRAINRIAPEHLEIMTAAPRAVAKQISNAACVFIGKYSPVPMGDYIAGTNHTLPTAGTARFGSPLGVADFCKRFSLVEYSAAAFKRDSQHVEAFAEFEQLPNHAAAVRVRLDTRGAS